MWICARSGPDLSGDGCHLMSPISDRHGVHPDRAAGPGLDTGRDNVMDDARKTGIIVWPSEGPPSPCAARGACGPRDARSLFVGVLSWRWRVVVGVPPLQRLQLQHPLQLRHLRRLQHRRLVTTRVPRAVKNRRLQLSTVSGDIPVIGDSSASVRSSPYVERLQTAVRRCPHAGRTSVFGHSRTRSILFRTAVLRSSCSSQCRRAAWMASGRSMPRSDATASRRRSN